MANHLTPSELAELVEMDRHDVITKCVEMKVPIFNGRIDKSLFISNLRAPAAQAEPTRQEQAAA